MHFGAVWCVTHLITTLPFCLFENNTEQPCKSPPQPDPALSGTPFYSQNTRWGTLKALPIRDINWLTWVRPLERLQHLPILACTLVTTFLGFHTQLSAPPCLHQESSSVDKNRALNIWKTRFDISALILTGCDIGQDPTSSLVP